MILVLLLAQFKWKGAAYHNIFKGKNKNNANKGPKKALNN